MVVVQATENPSGASCFIKSWLYGALLLIKQAFAEKPGEAQSSGICSHKQPSHQLLHKLTTSMAGGLCGGFSTSSSARNAAAPLSKGCTFESALGTERAAADPQTEAAGLAG